MICIAKRGGFHVERVQVLGRRFDLQTCAAAPSFFTLCSRHPAFVHNSFALEVLTPLVANSIRNHMECGQRLTPPAPVPTPTLTPTRPLSRLSR